MRVVRSVQINYDTVDLAYVDDVDVRVGGAVVQTHHVSVARSSNYDDEIEALEVAAERLVSDVLVDWAASPPYDLTQEPPDDEYDDDDDDEELG